MSLARENNGLDSLDLHPWHIRGTYTISDLQGDSQTGTYEEWWASPARYKRTYSGATSTYTFYTTGSSLYRLGPQDWPIDKELLLRSSLIESLPDLHTTREFILKHYDMPVGSGKLSCVKLTYALPANTTVSEGYFPSHCFDSKIPVLVMSSTGPIVTTYNQIVLFQGHYLAKKLYRTVYGRPQVELQLNLIESLKESPEETLTIPTEAVLVELSAPIRVGKAFTTHAVLPLKQLGGSYPAEAINKQIQGPVAVEATIRADGYVSEVRAISGPMQLHQGPIDSVNHWYFKPYRVIGQPVELQIEVPWRYENLAIPW